MLSDANSLNSKSISKPKTFDKIGFDLCVKLEDEEEAINIYATSNVALAELKKIENLYLTHLTNYVNAMQEKVFILNKYIKSIKHDDLKDEKQRFEYVTNSLNSFRLVRRSYEDWSKWLAYIKDQDNPKDQLEEMDKLVAQVPVEVDMKEALMGMERIERFYQLKSADIAKGLIGIKQFTNHMSAPECLILADYLYNNTEYHRAAQWYRLALYYEKQPMNRIHKEIYAINREEIRKMFLQSRIKETEN